MVKNFMVKISALILWCLVLAGCFVDHLLNYPFRVKEIIASFPIDPDSREPQIFVLDNIQTEKEFLIPIIKGKFKNPVKVDTNRYFGPYTIDLCTTDDLVYDEYYPGDLKLLMTFSVDGVEPQVDTVTYIGYTGVGCEHFSGWIMSHFRLPADIDLNQKAVLTFQILEDDDGILKTMSNLKLVFWAGTGQYF